MLCAELPCSRDGELWRTGNDRLAGLVRAALRDRGLPDPGPVRRVAVRRLPNVYPVYRVGYATPFQALDAWAAAQPALLSFGRLGLFVHDNTHHALAMAWAAADALAPGRRLRPRRLGRRPRGLHQPRGRGLAATGGHGVGRPG